MLDEARRLVVRDNSLTAFASTWNTLAAKVVAPVRSGPGRLLDEATAATALQLATAVTLSAGASWLIASGRGGVLMTGAVLGLGVIGLLRWPALTLVVLLIVCQELDPSADFAGSAGGTGLLYLGHQLFFKTVSRFSLVTLTTIICFARIAVVAPPRRPRKLAVGLVLLMGATTPPCCGPEARR